MKIKILLIIYNESLNSSETISSLFEADLPDSLMEIIIWNNGPEYLSSNDIDDYINRCKEKNISTKIFQDTKNISLSKIYNYFVHSTDYDFISIFDQDTRINNDFFQNIEKNSNVELICPEIYLSNKNNIKSSPVYNKSKNNTEFVEPGDFNANAIFTCASGLSLSSGLIHRILNQYNFVFDERYAFYWVDHDFFERLYALGCIKALCAGKIYHDMSGVGNDYSHMKESAKLEHGYGKILRRIYNENKTGTFRNLIYAIKYISKSKCSVHSGWKMLICALWKRHPRSKFSIDKNIQATHYYQSK